MSRLQVIILMILFALAAGLNLRNYHMRQEIEKKLRGGTLRVGDNLASLRLSGSDAVAQRPAGAFQSERPHLLFIFASNCRYSFRATTFWNELNERLANRDIRILGISTSAPGTNEALKRKLDVPILTIDPAERSRLSRSFLKTPQTTLLNPQGRVLKNWIGLPQSRANKRSIEDYFNLHDTNLRENRAQ